MDDNPNKQQAFEAVEKHKQYTPNTKKEKLWSELKQMNQILLSGLSCQDALVEIITALIKHKDRYVRWLTVTPHQLQIVSDSRY